jgi:hypothetical protein
MNVVPRNDYGLARQPPGMRSALSPTSVAPGTQPKASVFADDSLATVPLFADVDPVLVGIIAVLLLIVFVFFLLIRKVITSFTEGMREGRQ